MDPSSHGSVMGYVMATFGELLNCHMMGIWDLFLSVEVDMKICKGRLDPITEPENGNRT